MIKLHIDVTQADINNGVQENCELCPIALALKRALENDGHELVWIRVDGSLAFGTTKGQFNDFNVDHRILRFIEAFDDEGGSAVEPFEFEATFIDLSQE